MADKSLSSYRQVKNPDPVFIPREGKGTLPFCRKLMARAEGFTSLFDFSVRVAFRRSLGQRRRTPPVLRRRAIDALLQGLCFHFDPLANRVQRSITNLAIECGLATESSQGNLSITRATRALRFMEELGFISYQTEYDPRIGCNIPSDITFMPALFSALDVSEISVAAARRSRVEWENKKRKKQGQTPLGMDELAASAWRFVRERFRAYHAGRKLHGLKRARARQDSERSRKEIATLVRQQLTREIARGRFVGTLDTVRKEAERRIRERMLISRNGNFTRLTTTT